MRRSLERAAKKWMPVFRQGRATIGDSRPLGLALALAAALALAPAALGETSSPFIAPAPPKPKIVRLLAFAGAFDMKALQEFEQEAGFEVAYDAYDGAADLAQRLRDGSYDLVVLSGPAMAQQIARGALAKLDKTRLRNARAVQPVVAAKLAAYDPSGAYAIPAGWFAVGLIYDTDKMQQRLGGPPASWANLFVSAEVRKLGDCGVVLPDDRDALFIAAWRTLGVNPARARPLDVKSAGALLARARLAVRAFPAPDVAGALASGAACLAVGDAGEAEAATARSHEAARRRNSPSAFPGKAGRWRSRLMRFRAMRRTPRRVTRCSTSCCAPKSPRPTPVSRASSARSNQAMTKR